MRLQLLAIFLLSISLTCYSQKSKKVTRDPIVTADSLFVAGDFKGAIPNYVTALKKSQPAPTAQTWFRLGFAYHSLKDYVNAVDAYRKAEKINPKQPGLRVNLAKAYSASGDVNSAMVTLDSAVAAGFGNYKLTDSDADFENLRKNAGYAEIRKRIYQASHPCENLPAARAFDFWIGNWDVYQTSNMNVKAGENKISRRSGGCVIMEEWESQAAHNGVSINYFDPTKGKWQQKWAGSGQDIMEFYDGEYVDNVMRFKFDIVNPNGTIAPGKLEFTNMESGNVRQHFMRSTDEGKTWQTVYDFTYVKQKS